MTTKNKIFRIILMLLSFYSFAQTEEFKFKRKIENVSEAWHKIVLPEASFARLNPDFSDIRIFRNGSQSEAPYLLKSSGSEVSEIEIPFKMINASSRGSMYFYTFELPEGRQINQIKLHFSQDNFDWKIGLEGSNNQKEWFAILENYRILSIKNSQTDYQFAQADFPDSKYQFYRINIRAPEPPKLLSASISEQKKNEGSFRTAAARSIKKETDFKQKRSIIYLELQHKVPVSKVAVAVSNAFDYYRPIQIEVLKDSIETEKGWHYKYEAAAEGTLSSLDRNGFPLGNILAKKLKITIENHSNQPLEIKDVIVESPIYYLLARFTEKGEYSLFYGNPKASLASYDIENFQENIPKDPAELLLGNEEANPDFKRTAGQPLFENKLWLWALMILIIAVLAYFSLKMMREQA
ncbi:MAG TPA: DUF3999 family protein [Flavobacterium sp.]|nr:DUF3999 family protein [Flavobacterium sp.]